MRDAEPDLVQAQQPLSIPHTACFIVVPGAPIKDGLPLRYAAFVQYDHEKVVGESYTVGETGIFRFEKPVDSKSVPMGWRYTIQLTALTALPGNLTAEIRRPKDDKRLLNAEEYTQAPQQPSTEVCMFPETSDLSSKRSVNCANVIRNTPGLEADEMRRYVLGNDLHEPKRGHGIFESPLLQQEPIVLDDLLRKLSPSQLNAFEHIKNTKHPFSFIQGPPGIGKTALITTNYAMLHRL